MKNFLLWLIFSMFGLAQTLPWTGNSTDAWLKQSPNALVLPKAGAYIKLSGQTNRLSISSDQLLLDGNPIGGTTIYTGDGTLPSDRFVDGDGHLMSFFGNGLFLAESASGSTLQGGTNLIAIAPAGIEFRTPGLPTATSGQILTLSGGLVDYFDVVGSSGGQTNWGIVVRDPSDGTAKNTGVTIADIITGGGPGGTNQNFANTDLTATGNRTHDWDGNSFNMINVLDWDVEGTGTVQLNGDLTYLTGLSTTTINGANQGIITLDSSGIAAVVDSGTVRVDILTTGLTLKNDNSGLEFNISTSGIYDGNANVGDVLTLLDASTGSSEWGPAPAGPNFANADLMFTGNRTHDADGNNLTIQNTFDLFLHATNSFNLVAGDNSGNPVSIYGSSTEGLQLHTSPGLYFLLQPDGYQSSLAGMVLVAKTDSTGDVEYRSLPFPLNGVPTVAAGAGAGGSPTVTLANETDSAFTLNVTAGTSPATDDDIAVVTFASTYAAAPHYSLSSGNKPAATLSGASQVWATTTTTNLTLHSNSTGLTATTNYIWEIIVVR